MARLILTFLLCCCALFSSSSLATHPSDLQALRSIRAAITFAPPSSCVASWDFAAHDPCARTSSLCGFTCDASSNRITALELEPAGYTGTLSPAISSLAMLQLLDLSRNSFTGSIPSQLGSLLNLQKLDLSSNSLTGSIPPSLSSLTKLEHLDLQQNELSGSLPSSLTHASALRYFDASRNRLSGASALSRLPKSLFQISLRSNKLSGQLKHLADFRDVEVLDLSNNDFSGHLGPALFLSNTLQQLNISRNRFTSIKLELNSDGSSSQLDCTGSNLIAFDASKNRIAGELPAWLPKLKKLSAIYLSDNLFSGRIPVEYAKKTAPSEVIVDGEDNAAAPLPLSRLFVDGNYLRGELPAALVPNLVSASFANNCLSGCSPGLSFCHGGQKPQSQCKAFYYAS